MRVLMVHNAYQQFGGEDAVCANERDLLAEAGHEVELLSVSNNEITGPAAAAKAALNTVYSRSGRASVSQAIARFKPDLVHVHNHFPLISPSMFDATSSAGVPSVWTLHNFRVTCANGSLFRDGRPCEDCVGRSPLSAMVNRCYRGSLPGSAAVAASIAFHKVRETWLRKVDRFIALNEFSRSIFIAAGLPAERVVVKPNFAFDSAASTKSRSGAVYIGRLTVEKGLHTLLRGWQSLDLPLTVAGDGPLRNELEAAAPPNVRFVGRIPREDIAALLCSAEMLIVPSINYENFPMTVVEAFSTATPIVASRIGALRTIVKDGMTGRLFAAGNPDDLARVVDELHRAPVLRNRMGQAARRLYEEQLSPKSNLALLTDIYADAIAETHARMRAGSAGK